MCVNRYKTAFERSACAGPPRVLIVDDEIRYLRFIKSSLRDDYEVLTTRSAEAALEIAAREALDLILLDDGLPDRPGYEVCERVRDYSRVPIIVLTIWGRVADIVRALDAGADDCVTKPFSAEELSARIRAVMRRTAGHIAETRARLRVDGIEVDVKRRRVFRGGEEIHLTPTEYKLLVELMRNAGKVLVPDYLLEVVWGYTPETQPRLLWQAVHRLRQKIEPDPGNPTHIHTRRGVGYLFSSEEG
jgi:two-component system KDP operon response regulator KdpE